MPYPHRCLVLVVSAPQALPHLESLLLEGNGVRKEPCYRLYVIGTLSPTLVTLDKTAITAEERAVGTAEERAVGTSIYII